MPCRRLGDADGDHQGLNRRSDRHAYTYSKHGEAWKIDAQAWGRTT